MKDIETIIIALVFLIIGYVMGRISAKPVLVGQAKEYNPGEQKNFYDDDPYKEALEGPVDDK